MTFEVQFGFTLAQPVEIIASGVSGKVVGNWIDKHSIKQVCVEYVDQTGNVKDVWFDEAEVKDATPKPADGSANAAAPATGEAPAAPAA